MIPGELGCAGRRLLFFTRELSPWGGGCNVVAWALQALREDWEVTLLCARQPRWDAVNNHFGTRLDPADYRVRTLPRLLDAGLRLDQDPQSIQPLAWLTRRCHRLQRHYDLLFSADDEVDFGRPGIQYVHFPRLPGFLPVLRRYAQASAGARLRGLVRGELRPWMLVAGIDPARIERNLFLANSHWTAAVIRSHYAVEPQVLYPPVRLASTVRPWQERRLAFVVLGRLSRRKRQLDAIELLQRVRARGHAVELHLIGDPDRRDAGAYARRVEQHVAAAGDWVQLHQSVSRERLEGIVSRCRFGLHLMQDEHFGIAVAEMMSHGCAVFVHDSGGPVEIVGEELGLRFDGYDEALEKICRLLNNLPEQLRLSEAQARRASRFGAEQFMSDLRRIVRDYARATSSTDTN